MGDRGGCFHSTPYPFVPHTPARAVILFVPIRLPLHVCLNPIVGVTAMEAQLRDIATFLFLFVAEKKIDGVPTHKTSRVRRCETTSYHRKRVAV